MRKVFICTTDDKAPNHILEAGENGMLQTKSSIGWIDLSEDDFTGVKCGCEYRIKNCWNDES